MAVLGLRFCARAFLVVASRGHSSLWCAGLSLLRPLLLWSTDSRRAGSVAVAHRPSCSAVCGIFPDQGSNPCPLHWQADSQQLRHQESPFLFFLMSLTNGLSILFIFSKNQLLVLLIFAVVFFVSISFISTLIFMISFLLLTLGFDCSSFLVPLGVRLDCLFEIFLVSLGRLVLL